MRLIGLVFAALLLAAAAPAVAAQPAAAPVAKPVPLETVRWLAGRWEGEGMGGYTVEGWADPHLGQMAGYFTLYKDGKPVFHEMMLLEEHDGGLRLRVKHFNPDFTGWEEKSQSTDFKFVSASADELAFTAITFRRDGPDRIVINLRLRDDKGVVRNEVFQYRRIR